jgi:phage-related holin
MLPTSTMTPLLHQAAGLFEKYVFDDWNALGFLMVLFLMDTLLGMARSFKQRRFHSRGMRQMFRKMGEYALGIVVAHVFSNIEVDGSKLPWAEYLGMGVKGLTYIFILIIEAKSIDENMRGLGMRGLPLPKAIRERMADFEETGEFRSKVPPTEAIPPTQPIILQDETC